MGEGVKDAAGEAGEVLEAEGVGVAEGLTQARSAPTRTPTSRPVAETEAFAAALRPAMRVDSLSARTVVALKLTAVGQRHRGRSTERKTRMASVTLMVAFPAAAPTEAFAGGRPRS